MPATLPAWVLRQPAQLLRSSTVLDVFAVKAPYQPSGDQPKAIDELSKALADGEKWVTLHGITGSGKSAVMAWTIERLQRPALVIAPNKSLAAQLAGELSELLPDNKVCYFVSYYDFYRPEAYVASSDVFIDKEAVVNAEIDRLRHEATAALLFRRDVVVVASVSCIYGLGAPQSYLEQVLVLKEGMTVDRDEVTHQLVSRGYERNDIALERGTFRVRGDVLDVHLPGDQNLWRIEWYGDEIERIRPVDALTATLGGPVGEVHIWPKSHHQMPQDQIDKAIVSINTELEDRLTVLRAAGKLLEAQRLEQRCLYDQDMLRETGSCAGVENYSRHMDGRKPGEPPFTLLDYFAADRLVFLDESHVGVPQIRGSWAGDASRKATLIEHGFRLPSAADNRPLRWDEFVERAPQVVLVTATPTDFERDNSSTVVELVVRPTGLVDPIVSVQPSIGQLDDLLERISVRQTCNERVLVTCTTKKSAEQLTEWLLERNVKARFMHSDVDTLTRIQLVRELRIGRFDVLVGVNLLREGLDLPEVSLVAILDADTQGFLRSTTALIQTIGRAARNVNGEAVLYATTLTPAMRSAIDETTRRRAVQTAYNAAHNITPKTITSSVRALLAQKMVAEKPGVRRRGQQTASVIDPDEFATKTVDELNACAVTLENLMVVAAETLEFEKAAMFRDQLAYVETLLEGRTQPPA